MTQLSGLSCHQSGWYTEILWFSLRAFARNKKALVNVTMYRFSIMYIPIKGGKISSIPLTAEWMTQSGFNMHQKSRWKYKSLRKLSRKVVKGKTKWMYGKVMTSFCQPGKRVDSCSHEIASSLVMCIQAGGRIWVSLEASEDPGGFTKSW